MKQGNHSYSGGSEAISKMTPSFDYYYQNPKGLAIFCKFGLTMV